MVAKTPEGTQSAREEAYLRAKIKELIRKKKDPESPEIKQKLFEDMDQSGFWMWQKGDEYYREDVWDTALKQANYRPKEEDSTATSHYVTTSHYTTRSWGFFDITTNTYAEQIEPNLYLCNQDGKFQLVRVQVEKEGEGKKERVARRFILVGEKEYDLPLRVWKARDFYYVPDAAQVEAFVQGSFKPRPIKEILQEVERLFRVLFDFRIGRDLFLWQVFLVQSHLKPILDNFFFMGIDATKGGGKTTLLEIGSLLSRHGYLGGDISAASLPRLVEELDLALFLDELDQRLGKGEDDSIAILRKGQRRGNPYVRLNKLTMIPEQFDVAGTHAFSFRGELEDAFVSRSIGTHTSQTADNRLAVINIYKRELLEPLQRELFFWRLQELPTLAKSLQSRYKTLDVYKGVVTCSGTSGDSIESFRQAIYSQATNQFSDPQMAMLQEFTGRNAELTYLLLRILNLLELDLDAAVKDVMSEKQTDELSGDMLLDTLREFLAAKYWALKGSDWILHDGEHMGCVYYRKSSVYQEFNATLKDKNHSTMGTKRFTSLLRDMGFVQALTIRSQRPPSTKTPTLCVIFTPEILDSLGVNGEKSVPMKEVQEEIITDSSHGWRDWVNAQPGGVVEVDALLMQFPALDIVTLRETGELYEPKPGFLRVLP